MIKLIASDIDGTLVPEGACTMNPEYFEVIRKLKEQGILFVAASGRQYASMHALLKPIENEIIFIAGNGTNVMQSGKQIICTDMNRQDIQAAVFYMRSLKDAIVTVSDAEKIYLETDDEEFQRFLVEVYHNEIEVVPDVLKADIHINKMAIHKKNGVHDIAEQTIREFEDRFRVLQAGDNWIDFIDYSAGKGTALKQIQEKYGILPSETMVFGDNFNDVQMFKTADISYATDSGPEAVKKEAKYIVEDYRSDGVLKVLKSLLSK